MGTSLHSSSVQRLSFKGMLHASRWAKHSRRVKRLVVCGQHLAYRRTSASTSSSQASLPKPQGSSTSWQAWLLYPAIGSAIIFGTSLASSDKAFLDSSTPTAESALMRVSWIKQLAAQEGQELVLSASTMHTHPLLKKDHMFSNLHQHDMVHDLLCFFDAGEQRLQYIIQLGRNVCGFPSIMHGGLTAAIVDECFGFLWLSLRANKQLTFTGPAFTAHLEVDYKKKIPAGRLLLCTTEVESCEGRKLWMRAEVKDGPNGQVYATARALFVRPQAQRLLKEGFNLAYSYLRS